MGAGDRRSRSSRVVECHCHMRSRTLEGFKVYFGSLRSIGGEGEWEWVNRVGSSLKRKVGRVRRLCPRKDVAEVRGCVRCR